MEVQSEWKQICHLCWWELAWCHSLKSEWGVAAQYSDHLYKESKWSKASFLYMKASFLLMERDCISAAPPDQTVSAGQSSRSLPGQTMLVGQPSRSLLGQTVSAGQPSRSPPGQRVSDESLAEMMRNIAPLKQRIAGKSLPVEKFAVAQSERYLAGEQLPVPGMELLYSHNAYLLLRENPPLLKKLLRQVWDKLLALEQSKDSNPSYEEHWTVVTFIQGCLFSVLQRNDEAEKCFLDVISRADLLLRDSYVVPAATAELGLLYIVAGNLDEAERRLQTARTNYKGYHLESRIHFRIHAGLDKILQLRKANQQN